MSSYFQKSGWVGSWFCPPHPTGFTEPSAQLNRALGADGPSRSRAEGLLGFQGWVGWGLPWHTIPHLLPMALCTVTARACLPLVPHSLHSSGSFSLADRGSGLGVHKRVALPTPGLGSGFPGSLGSLVCPWPSWSILRPPQVPASKLLSWNNTDPGDRGPS